MAYQAVPEAALLRALHSLGPYVILRNHDVLAHLATGGDIDLLVADRRQAERRLVAELGTPVFVARRSYVTGLFYNWGHIDLIPSLQWRGATYLDAASVLQNRQLSSYLLPRPRLAHEALVSWFSSLVWGGFFKSRYRDVIVEAATKDGDELRRTLTTAVGRRWALRLQDSAAQGRPEESEAWALQIRRALWRHALARAPIQTIMGRLRFYAAEARLHLNPPLPWLAVLGPDGSGKSTLLAGLGESWPKSLGPVHIYHLRPGRVAQRKGRTGPVVDPHGQPCRGPVLSVAALVLVMFDWWIGYWTRIVRQRAKHGLVVFDRHLLDLLVDPVRYRYGGPRWVAKVACRLVPRPDVIVVLDGSPAVFRARKQEVSPSESIRQCIAYRRLAADTPGTYLVDAGMLPARVRDATLNILRQGVKAA
jgi:thymidylate kinase